MSDLNLWWGIQPKKIAGLGRIVKIEKIVKNTVLLLKCKNIKEHVNDPGSMIYMDCWKVYKTTIGFHHYMNSYTQHCRSYDWRNKKTKYCLVSPGFELCRIYEQQSHQHDIVLLAQLLHFANRNCLWKVLQNYIATIYKEPRSRK